MSRKQPTSEYLLRMQRAFSALESWSGSCTSTVEALGVFRTSTHPMNLCKPKAQMAFENVPV